MGGTPSTTQNKLGETDTRRKDHNQKKKTVEGMRDRHRGWVQANCWGGCFWGATKKNKKKRVTRINRKPKGSLEINCLMVYEVKKLCK